MVRPSEDLVVQSKVFGWEASGLIAATIVGALLIGVALSASIGPARRANRCGLMPVNYYYSEGYNASMKTPDALGEFEEALLLAVVHLAEGAYGVAIRQEIERRTGREIAVGALYTSLGRLERKGYVRSTMSGPTPDRGGRSKRYFVLRPNGLAALKQSRARHDRMWAGLSPDLRRTRP